MRRTLSCRLLLKQRAQQEGKIILSNTSNGNTTNPVVPSAAQLAEARLKRWHQQGEALLTMENLRSWMNTAGLVLFAPRPQIVAPAATLVEAVLGAANASPTMEQIAEARGLLGRLVAEGLAVPLNLMGGNASLVGSAAQQSGTFGAGDTPDFVASTAVFSYVFTLRGDKAWKQPPATTGAVKVSHLAAAVHEALARRGALTAFDLAVEVGKEATEAAVLRALNELWTHLRVLPLAQSDGRPAVWELTSARFIKQMKAGANAGQPSALSALISLYLGQAVIAAEDEIEGFLSPLAARSRIRDVVHTLLSARQLDTVAVEGRTMLHVAGEMPGFLAAGVVAPDAAVASAKTEAVALAAGGESVDSAAAVEGAGEAAARITKFIPKPRKIGTGYLAKAKPARFGAETGGKSQFPAQRFGTGAKPGFGGGFKGGDTSGFTPRGKDGFRPRVGAGPAPDRERRPFSKAKAAGFDKPWEEERAKRLAAARRPSDVREGEGAGGPNGVGAKPRFSGKPAFGAKAKFGGKPAIGGEGRPARKTFSKPGTFGRKRDERVRGFGAARPQGGGFAPRKPFAPRADGPKRFGDKPRFAPQREAGKGAEGAERGAGGAGTKQVYRKFDAPRDGARRPAARKFDAATPRGERPGRGFPAERAGGAGERAGRPSGNFAPRKFAGKAGGKPGGFGAKDGAKFAGKPRGGFGAKAGSGFGAKAGAKPGGGFAGKTPFGKTGKPFGKTDRPFAKSGKPFAGKPAGTFAKFAGGKKPFGKRPPARKFKPKEGESA
jgi:hypothetical protein